MTLQKIKTEISSLKFYSLVKKIHREFPAAKIYLVGGAVRDFLIDRETTDYDLVIAKVPIYELKEYLATVGEVDLVGDHFGVFKFRSKKIKIIEDIDIALPRQDYSWGTGGYKDFEIQSDPNLSIEKDLSRRDFTINAMAIDLIEWQLIDPYGGVEDLADSLIKTVGVPQDRLAEDYTRMVRAVRFACQLNFKIDEETFLAIREHSHGLNKVSIERTREEFIKIINSPMAEHGVLLLHKLNLLKFIIPELLYGVGVNQNKNHIFTVFEHSHKSLGFAAEKNYSFEVRLAALLHDVGKPQTKHGVGQTSTFYNHEIVSAKLTKKILGRLKFPHDQIEKITLLVRHHMFYYSMGQVTDAGVRRILARVGKENLEELIRLRICDRLGMGRPKAKPYKLLELEKRLQEVQMDPISTKMLKVDGSDVMKILKIAPGPQIGLLLGALLEEVLTDPTKNTKKYLTAELKKINELPTATLKQLQPKLDSHEADRKKKFFRTYKEIE